MVRGIVQNGAIQPVDPLPREWADGRRVRIESEDEVVEVVDQHRRDEIEEWYATLEKMGAARYAPGERDAIDRMMAEADHNAKRQVQQDWLKLNGSTPTGHEPPQRSA